MTGRTGRRSTTPGRRWRSTSSRRTPTSRPTRYNPSEPGDVRGRVATPDAVPVRAGQPASPVGHGPDRRRAEERPTAPPTSTACTGCSTSTTCTASADSGRAASGPTATGTSYINTFQRGPQESVWETVPQPSCETFKYGGTNGYLDLFTKDSSYAKQWKYTNAPDADARAVAGRLLGVTVGDGAGQAGARSPPRWPRPPRWATTCATRCSTSTSRSVGCTSPSCAAGTGKDAASTTCSPGTTPGAARSTRRRGWAWRIGSRTRHHGYQNPIAAWVLSTDAAHDAEVADRQVRLGRRASTRQLEFYQWLQSPEGGIAGGATNSWNGEYATPAGRHADLLRHGLRPRRRSTTTRRRTSGSACRPGAWSASPSTTTPGRRQVPRRSSTSGSRGRGQHHGLGAHLVRSRPTLTWTGKPDTWNAASPGANTGLQGRHQEHRPGRRRGR